MKKETINLLEHYEASEKIRKGKSSGLLKTFALGLIMVLLLSAYSITLFIQNVSLNESNQEIQDYINNPATLAQIKDITEKQRRLTDLNEILAELKSLNAAFAVMPRMDSDVLAQITDLLPTDSKVTYIEFDGQWITIQTSSTNLLRPSEFARSLRNSGLFEDVIYDGYSVNTSGKTTYISSIKVAIRIGGN